MKVGQRVSKIEIPDNFLTKILQFRQSQKVLNCLIANLATSTVLVLEKSNLQHESPEFDTEIVLIMIDS